MIARSKPPRRKRPGTRRGQATPEEVERVREAVYARAAGRCELRMTSDCIPGVMPKEGPVLGRAHLVHMKGKRMWGTSEAICKLGCWFCHLVTMHRGGKVVPPKERN